MVAQTHDTETRSASVLSASDGWALFDRQAHRLLGISGQEFLRRWDAGAYRNLDDTPEAHNVMHLVLLMPFGRR